MIGSGKRVKDVLPILYFVVPCYNDAQTLTASAPILLRKLTSFIDRETVHPDSRVLFVNDGSSDNTWDTIVSLPRQILIVSKRRGASIWPPTHAARF